MGDVRNPSATGEDALLKTQAAFPQLPGEDFLAHAGAQYLEQVDARLADLGLLSVAKDGADPDSVKQLIDFDLSLIPTLPATHPQYLCTMENRMKYQQHNASNEQKRLSLRYSAWTKVYTLFKMSTETGSCSRRYCRASRSRSTASSCSTCPATAASSRRALPLRGMPRPSRMRQARRELGTGRWAPTPLDRSGR